MVVTLTGENSFALQKELHQLIDAFVDEHGDLALERLDGESADLAKVQEALSGMPFLASKKMVLLRAVSTIKQVAEQVEQLFGDIPETSDVIIVEPKLDKRHSYYKFLKKHTDYREFPELDQHALAAWLVTTAKALDGTISQSDARYLIERVGAHQQLLSNELEKLLLHSPDISRQTIDLLTEATPQSTIFQLLEAAFSGNTKRSLQLYGEQRALNVEPIQIIAMLAWQLHVLAVIKTAGSRGTDIIAKDAKLNPFVVQKSQGIARELSLGRLKRLVSDLLKIDMASKRTNIDTDEALQNYLLTLAT